MQAAYQLDYLCPALDTNKATKDYFWMIWDIMINIARSPDVTNELHKSLVGIIQNLRQFAKGEMMVWGRTTRVWRDLPLLPMCMETWFSDPMLEGDDFNPKSGQIWRNMNAFGARCLGAGIAGAYAQAMYAMRVALEEEFETDMARTECRMQAAFEWITHASKPLLWWARENLGYVDVTVEDEANYVEGGALYLGPPTMCLRRWGFWLNRFEDFGKAESGLSEEIRNSALEAAQTMRAIERSIGNALSG